ncbi:hypothetical protein [Amycolatopsis sp.]|uniref:hypothetical protein n=1 Tax=Amycolatopsis sp. TaxID=37632 RepID=UPI002E0641E8|nr:hypothetical protein [Amycolatopsis sp.]
MIDLPQPTGSHLWPTEEPGNLAPLHRPRRAFVALAEVVVAGVVIWLALLVWDASSVTLTTTLTDGTQLISTRDFGGRIAGAIGLGVLAALLLVDAVRQLLLATRTRHRKPKSRSTGFSQPTPS